MDNLGLGSVLLREAEVLAREKFLERDAVVCALEDALRRVSTMAYGPENDISVSIDRNSGEVRVARHRRVVGEVSDVFKEVAADEVAYKGVSIGDDFVEELPLKLGRSYLQTVKSSLMSSIYEMERERQFKEFSNRVGDLVTGVVKRVEFRNIFVDLVRAEGIILYSESIPMENFRVGDRVKAYVYAVERKQRGAQIFLSRAHPQFLAKIFAQEVPEVDDGVVEIRSIAREPGSRAKVAVCSRDASVDPVGTCVGVKGSRVNAVSQELHGEKIDMILWSQDKAVFVVNALTPAEVVKVIIDNVDESKITVVVPDNQQSIAIGRRGQNVELAHQLTGCHLSIVSESEEKVRRSNDVAVKIAEFTEKLDIDEMMAHFLLAEGFESIKDIASSQVEELSSLQGFDSDLANELIERAKDAHDNDEKKNRKLFVEDAGGDERLLGIGVPMDLLIELAGKGIRSIEDFAYLSIDDMKEFAGEKACGVRDSDMGNFIMKAREIALKDENGG
ncbi:transcription termination factor NusA [Candidatus Hydrogenosomobacter endosymbioticus]|uniref:Transcription termination/antitermination protein NusA n=1 Tax=Candidatus Hydrogenosomobacter endosymbioticus TaxID=2558174 RepID=A0ABM7V8Z7_9PROT|nr:transcription termination factor NusA [Candidatus Hydrogenosomobacter endosymbioticus]BDB96273.1 transcription termination/antitermination protein NusA [Candidatus Hydrogenosomobacter endosymbioticus]